MNEEKVFASGLFFRRPNEGAPTFVKGSVGVKVDEFVAFLEKNKAEDGWVRLDLKESQGGKLYFQLNTWKPKTVNDVAPSDYPDDKDIDKIPF